jgi:topoisomerase IV subunit A
MPDNKNIDDKLFDDIIGEKYLAYALSTIMSRSLPDVRDGLKPVHRRIMYDMMLLKLNPNTPYKKSARVVGDVIGKFHPHGDQAVYDSMVRMAQEFTTRYPLIDGQGNFGSVDGDNAAAMRYTESKLTNIALALLEDIDEDTVIFNPNYDGQEIEPSVLPARFPNLLANGSEGIAVGMATSIPPHNLHELCDALINLNQNKDLTVAELITKYIKGPDFPTGGTIIESQENLIQYYTQGKGSFKVRAKWEVEHLNHGLYQIVITEIPYQVQKSKLIEKIADLFREKKLNLISNIRDESTDKIRVILEPKNRTIDANIIMETLFKTTDLENRVMLNMNVITNKSIPKVLNIKEVLLEFLEHRDEIILKRSHFRLNKILARLEILDGLLIAYLNLDEVINIIRNEDNAKIIMIEKFSLTENQVEAILNMRLRSLRKLEEIEIRKEYDNLSKDKKILENLINKQDARCAVIEKELFSIQENFGLHTQLGARRTNFEQASEIPEISIEAFVEKEQITIISSQQGWIKAVKGHNVSVDDVKYKEGDCEGFIIKSYTTNKLIIYTEQGKFYTVSCHEITRGKGHGDSLKIILDIDESDQIAGMFISEDSREFILCASNGKGFVISENDLIAQTKSGKKIINTQDNETLAICQPIEGDRIAIIGTNRKLLIFDVKDLPHMKKGQGVTLQKYKDSKVSDIKTFNKDDGLSWKLGEKTRVETNLLAWEGKRGQIGRLPPVGFPRNNKFS